MNRRHRKLPRQWLITDERLGDRLHAVVSRLPRGSGVLIRHHHLTVGERTRLARKLRGVARLRKLVVIDEANAKVARVHNAREVQRAQLRGASPLFLSPMYPTRSHPKWKPLPRMRAAALQRLARVPVIALGGMTARRFAHVKPLGFHGWAGIDAWLRT